MGLWTLSAGAVIRRLFVEEHSIIVVLAEALWSEVSCGLVSSGGVFFVLVCLVVDGFGFLVSII